MTRRVNLATIKDSLRPAFIGKFLAVASVLVLVGGLLFNTMQLIQIDNRGADTVQANQKRALGKSTKKAKKTAKKSTNSSVLASSTVQSLDCITDGPAHGSLASSFVSQLSSLSDYEAVCGGKIADRLMIFEATPANTTEAKAMARDVARQLKEFSRYGVAPLVIFEPSTSKGLVNFQDYANGSYDAALDTYFSTIAASGVNSTMMGLWVSFPEANIPTWQTTNPNLFAACVNKTVKAQKKYFPGSKASILLQSMSYPSGWGSGQYVSLSPYLKNISKGLLDSFGYQGFAWPDPQPDYNAGHFLNPSLAIAAGKQLGVKEVWFNTGTFKQGKAYNGQIIKLTPAQRQAILNDIITQAKTVKANGFKVAINIFAENKFNTSEGIDWSYWPKGKADSSPDTAVFTSFVHNLKAAGLKLWLFDADD